MTFHQSKVANYLLVLRQRYIETIYFWNHCERSYHTIPAVTFTSPEVANYLPYFTQKYIETTSVSHQYTVTSFFSKFLSCGKTFNCSLNNWFLILLIFLLHTEISFSSKCRSKNKVSIFMSTLNYNLIYRKISNHVLSKP